MVQALDIKGVKLGEGRPKTIISLMGAHVAENIELIEKGIASGVECFEWRGDFAADVHDPQKMAEHSMEIGKALPNSPPSFHVPFNESGRSSYHPGERIRRA